MPSLLRSLALLLLMFAGCQRATPEQCDKLCWRFNELSFWEQFEADTKDLAPEGREKARVERQKQWAEMRARQFDPGLDNCVRECRKSAKPDDLKCAEAATTLAAMQACLTED